MEEFENDFEKLEGHYRDLVESSMPFLKIYPDFIVEHSKDASGRGKPTTDVLRLAINIFSHSK